MQLVSAGDGNVHIWNLDFESTLADAKEMLGFELTDEARVALGMDYLP